MIKYLTTAPIPTTTHDGKPIILPEGAFLNLSSKGKLIAPARKHPKIRGKMLEATTTSITPDQVRKYLIKLG